MELTKPENRDRASALLDAFREFIVSEGQKEAARLEAVEAKVQALTARLAEVREGGSVVVPITTFAPEPFDLVKEIKAVVEESDGEFVASFYDANVSSQGCNRQEAIDNLKDALLSSFDYLDGAPPEKLGPGLKSQLAVLREFIRRRD